MGRVTDIAKKLARLLTRQSDTRPADHFKGLRRDMSTKEYVQQFEKNAGLRSTGKSDG